MLSEAEKVLARKLSSFLCSFPASCALQVIEELKEILTEEIARTAPLTPASKSIKRGSCKAERPFSLLRGKCVVQSIRDSENV